MPALLQALKISEKAVNQGFEWENEGQVWEKLESEICLLYTSLLLHRRIALERVRRRSSVSWGGLIEISQRH